MNRTFRVTYYDKVLKAWRSRQFKDQHSAEAFIEIRTGGKFLEEMYSNFRLIIIFEPKE